MNLKILMVICTFKPVVFVTIPKKKNLDTNRIYHVYISYALIRIMHRQLLHI